MVIDKRILFDKRDVFRFSCVFCIKKPVQKNMQSANKNS